MSSSIAQLLQTGLELHRSGRLQEAERYYQSVREQRPDHPDAWHLLGVLASQVGKHDIAVELVQEAIKRNPEMADFYVTCGEAYRALGKFELAIGCLREALKRRPAFPGAHLNLGNIFKEMGRFAEAEEQYRQAVHLQPGFAVAHNNLGIILRETGRQDEAIGCFNRSIELMPGNFEAYNNLGNTLLDLDRVDEAIVAYEKALAARPDYAEAHSNLGNALKKQGQVAKAIAHYGRALAIRPDFAMAHYNLGTALDDIGRPDDAISEYERALEIQPDYAEAHNNLANALDEVGRQEDAVGHYQRAIDLKPDYAEAYRNLARLRPQREQVAALQELLEKPSLPETDAIHCHFALGSILASSGDYAEAFEYYRRGNSLKRKFVEYDTRKFSAYVDRLISFYSKERFSGGGACGSDSELPVFILGMPRSGTSLVEQIVASHPQVYGGGELPFLVHAEESIAAHFSASTPYPECIPQLAEPMVGDLSRQYLVELRDYSGEALRITDKLPSNFLRVGLIKLMFPKARIIHCQRNAMDTCTSNFLNYFAFGNEYSFDLQELGQYYLDYRRLMDYWRDLWPSGMLELQYEELVANQEAVSRQVIGYLGLEWDDRCLDFHHNRRAVNTFSSMQVRQPVYTQSIDRWQHYRQQLAPLSAILAGA